MSNPTLSDIMEHVLSIAPEAVALSEVDGNIIISLNKKLDTDWNTLLPFEDEHDKVGDDN